MWAKSAGGVGTLYTNCIATDPFGNVVVAGYFSSPSITFGSTTLNNSGSGTGDIYLVKYDSNGNVVWARSAGGSADDIAVSVCTDHLGNIFVAGYYSSTGFTIGSTFMSNAGGDDIFLVKYDASGNVIWAKTAGGSGLEKANSVTTDAKGNIYLAGIFCSANLNFGPTTLINLNTSMFLAKYSATGNVVWAKAQNDSTDFCSATAVKTDLNGNVYVCGNFNGPTIKFDTREITNFSPFNAGVFLVKFDSTCNVIWAKGGASEDGGFGGRASCLDIDAVGNVNMSGVFSGGDMRFDTAKIFNTHPWTDDIFTVSCSSDGHLRWIRDAGGADHDEVYSISSDHKGNSYLAGCFGSSSITFGSSTLINSGLDRSDMFLAKFDSSGNCIWGQRSGGTLEDVGNSVATDDSGNVYVSGSFSSPEIGFGYTSLTECTGGAYSDLFVTKFNESTLLHVPESNGNVIAAPVPATSEIHLSSMDKISNVSIFTPGGKMVYTHDFNAENVLIDIASFPQGTYILKVNGIGRQKFIKQ